MQHLQLDIPADELPTNEQITALDISDPEDFIAFIKAFKYTLYRSQGDSAIEACRKIGMHRNTIYSEKWQGMLAKAQRLLLSKLSNNVMAANNMVFERWPEMMQRLVDDAANPATPARDRADVMEFLYMSVIAPSAEEKRDDSAERIYLQNLSKAQFNPLAPITIVTPQVNIGAQDEPTITITRRPDADMDADIVMDTSPAGNANPESDPGEVPPRSITAG